METRTIFLVGKPGCGKGTQAKLLARVTGWRVISGGDQFRAIASEDTPVGHKVKTIIDAGDLAPHWFAMHLYLRALFAAREGESIIFDGFSRRATEAGLIIDSLKWLDRTPTVLNVSVSDEEALRRLALRKDIEHRVDDNAVDARLVEYREHTEPAIEIFRKAGVLLEIDGERSPEVIAADIRAKLGL